ncbi:hypothetical protein RfFV1_gp2 [Rutstroemia firma fusarivirus 1]|uniref:Uncharacterized protein n=1 Tax=Rutstroemia firma fusarivirus 1 TaxID=2501220 RepID=A0AAD1EKS8_9VIRU|nr:hypothetical protein QKQ39_gp2 [Rutstroemia firma fusarivirus 1]AZT88660.1 hypothetical protein RfFV1_gp2 [Rutstroemia firma fusarivirus 1]
MSQENKTGESRPNAKKILEQLSSLASKPVTFGGQSGLFVHDKQLMDVADNIDKLLTEDIADDISVNELIDARGKVDDLVAKNIKANDMLKRAENDLSELKLSTGQLQKDYSNAISTQRENAAKSKSIIGQLKQDLEVAQEVQKHLKAEKKSANSFDIDKRAEIDSELSAQCELIQSLTSQLASSNKEKSDLSAKIGIMKKELAFKRENIKQKGIHVQVLENAKAEANLDLALKDRGFSVEVTSEARAALGKDGIEVFKGALLAASDQIKDRVWHLMVATQKSKVAKVKTLATLLRDVFEWCKTIGFKARLVIDPWVKRIINDLLIGKVMSLKFYREFLEEIVADFKKKQAIVKEEIKNAFPNSEGGFWDDAYSWVLLAQMYARRSRVGMSKRLKAIYLKGKAAAKSLSSRAKSGIVKCFNWVFDFFKVTKGETLPPGEIVLFNADDDLATALIENSRVGEQLDDLESKVAKLKADRDKRSLWEEIPLKNKGKGRAVSVSESVDSNGSEYRRTALNIPSPPSHTGLAPTYAKSPPGKLTGFSNLFK